MTRSTILSRRSVLTVGSGALIAPLLTQAADAKVPAGGKLGALGPLDPVRLELVMNLIVTCTNPERLGPDRASKDGIRDEIWPIVGGRFEGPDIRGLVVPGGGDFPVTRPDGVTIVDALYRLKTDDGVTIIIHNKGLAYPRRAGDWGKYRLVPEFTAPVGKYEWLNRAVFVCTLSEVPEGFELASGSDQNDRLLQIYRIG